MAGFALSTEGHHSRRFADDWTDSRTLVGHRRIASAHLAKRLRITTTRSDQSVRRWGRAV